MIREKQQIVVERTVLICDRCGKEISMEDERSEWQEHFAIRFRGGYGSVFGDGSAVEAEFCQHCIHEVLGKYCRVRHGHPFRPEHALPGEPEKILQPHQLDAVKQAEEFAERTGVGQFMAADD